MATLRSFVLPQTLFSVLRETCDERVRIVFRRFEAAGRQAELRAVSLAEDLAGLYLTGGYSEIYLSLGALPRSATDWDFPERAQDQVLVLTGGRQRDRVLECCTLRVLGKVSRARALYTRLRRALVARCRAGLTEVRTGTRYPDIYYEPEAVRFELRERLDSDHIVYQ